MANYKGDTRRFANMFKALSNPHRLSIFLVMMERCCPPDSCCGDENTSCVSEIGNCCEVAPSTLSHHLKELRNAGLLMTKKRGKFVDCWIEPETLAELSRFFQTVKQVQED